MLSELLKLANTVLELNKTTKKNSEDIAKLNQQVSRIINALNLLNERQKEAEKRHQSDMEKMALQLEVILLRHGVKVDASEIPKPQLPGKNE